MSDDRRRRWLLAALVLLALAASLSGLFNGFVLDDQIAIVDNPLAHSPWPPWTPFLHSYWPPRLGGGLYRPLTILFFSLQWIAGSGTPLLFHASNILLNLVVTLLLFQLGRRLTGEIPAFIGAAFFAVHPVHVEAVGNAVGQAELTAAACLLGALLLYVGWRQQSPAAPFPLSRLAAIAVLFVAGMLCKEHAIVLPALLLLAEWSVLARSGEGGSRLKRLLPLYLLLAGAALGYLLVRRAVLGSLTGDTAASGLGVLTAGQRLATVLAFVPEWLRLLFWPAHLRADYGIPEFQPVLTLGAASLAGAVILIGVAGLAGLTRRQSPLTAWSIGWIAVAILPSSNLFFPTGILLAERTLYFPSAGAALLVTALSALAWPWLQVHRWRQGTAAVLAATIIALGAGRSALRQRVWGTEDSLRLNMVLDSPYSAWAHWLYGIYIFDQGWHDLGERHIMTSVHLDPTNWYTQARLGGIYARYGYCGSAMGHLRIALTLSPRHANVRAALIGCLIQTHQFEAARREVQMGMATGEMPGMYQRALASVDSAAAAQPR